MATPTTPAEWLPILTKRLDEQAAEARRMRSQTDGTAPVPEMSKKTKKSWVSFQREADVLFAKIACESLAQRVRPVAVSVAADPGGDTEAEAEARRIWRTSRLDVVLPDAIRDAFIVGRSFLLNARDGFGRARITFEPAELLYAELDPLDDTSVIAAVKVWRDSIAGYDFARVWLPGFRQDFARKSEERRGRIRATNSGGWEPVTDVVASDASVPVTPLLNPDGRSEFADAIPLLNRIRRGILHRIVVIWFQAQRLRGIKNLPDQTDEAGNPVEYSSLEDMFDAYPGALLDLGTAEMWEGQVTDPTPLLTAVGHDVREFASSLSVPLPAMQADAVNQSAEGALAIREAQILKADDRRARFAPAIEGSLLKALRQKLGPLFDSTVDVTFAPAHLTTHSERAAAAVQAKAAGVPWRTIMTAYLGHTPDEVDRMQEERDDETLAQAAAAAAAFPTS